MKNIEYGTEFIDQLKDSVHHLHDEKELYKQALLDIKEYIEDRHEYDYMLDNYECLFSDLLSIVNKALGVDKE